MNNLSKPILFVGCLFIVGSCNQRYEPGTMGHIESVTIKVDNKRLVNADEMP